MGVERVREWRAIRQGNKSAYWRYKRIINNVKGKTVLDIGTGNGYLTYQLSKDYEVTSIDLARKAISSLREALNSIGLKAVLIADDFLKHNFNKQFDTVIMSEFIEHFNETQAKMIIKKAYTLTKKTLIITTPNSELTVKHEPTHIKEYDFNEFKELLINYNPVIQGTIIPEMISKEGYELAKDNPLNSRSFVAVINKS